ncbi:hypothetical protein N0B16_04780 [Chryseobacterium sp. GMJ5]|uniref:Outer membrane lipoprotein BamD-like domain-containing protein n=1 Tax=Chryseobacterium gilvum TaxID=2976534 RepID=A0ABT2VV49_9FLAO|nr:hypothetical protein [Chryseobacterium gilvum]MCU7613746.1 hypothetical protein [Chryseobacterium gilvum]
MRILAILILSVFLFACHQKESVILERKSANDTIAETPLKDDLYKPADTACSSENKPEDYIRSLQWYQAKTEKEIAKNTPEQNDKIYEEYLEIRNKYIHCLSSQLGDVLDNYVNYYNPENEQLQLPESVRKLSNELKKGSLEFREVGEGYTEIWSEPDHYYSIFGNKVTPDYNLYILQLSKESEKLYSADAGLAISWKELGERTVFWENFIKKYPDSFLISRAKELYHNYLYDYLFGMDNTPTYEHSDGTIYSENREEFNRIIKKYPNSDVAKKSKELMNLFDAKIPEEEIRKRINIDRKY